MTTLAWAMLVCAAIPFYFTLRNMWHYRMPTRLPEGMPKVSLLIPARNEEAGIEECLRRAVDSTDVELEVIVLDDHSTDRTAEIVRNFGLVHPQVRVESSNELPDGWVGKQHACWQLATLASHDIFVFIDADVHLHPDGLAMLVAFQQDSAAPLVSAFPKQITVTWMEKLVVPMIHFLLLAFLPMWWMRKSKAVSLGAGCGQLFLATREEYLRIGGHQLVKNSMHDGVKLPRAYRKNGLMTDLCNGVELAECRMYRNTSQVWNGFAKNAREGIGRMPLLLFFSVVLMLGQVLPLFAAAYEIANHGFEYYNFVRDKFGPPELGLRGWSLISLLIGLTTALLIGHATQVRVHPILGAFLLLSIQWYANFRHWIGKPVGWKGRTKVGVQPLG